MCFNYYINYYVHQVTKFMWLDSNEGESMEGRSPSVNSRAYDPVGASTHRKEVILTSSASLVNHPHVLEDPKPLGESL